MCLVIHPVTVGTYTHTRACALTLMMLSEMHDKVELCIISVCTLRAACHIKLLYVPFFLGLYRLLVRVASLHYHISKEVDWLLNSKTD